MADREWTALASAVVRAEAAVRLDTQGQTAQAVAAYRDVLGLLDDATVRALPLDLQGRVNEKVAAYVARLAVLQATPADGGRDPLTASVFGLEAPIGAIPEAVPSAPIYKPFWLMRVLSQSMRSGGYITPRLYVPRQLWYQKDVAFTGIQAKYTACDTLLIHILKLKDTSRSDATRVNHALEDFCKELDTLQNTLARKLNFVEDVRTDKTSGRHSLAKLSNRFSISVERLQATVARSRLEDDSEYIAMLAKVFDSSQFIEAWIDQYEPAQHAAIHARLQRISDFFYNVLCAFVLRDFKLLLDEYMKTTRNAFASSM